MKLTRIQSVSSGLKLTDTAFIFLQLRAPIYNFTLRFSLPRVNSAQNSCAGCLRHPPHTHGYKYICKWHFNDSSIFHRKKKMLRKYPITIFCWVDKRTWRMDPVTAETISYVSLPLLQVVWKSESGGVDCVFICSFSSVSAFFCAWGVVVGLRKAVFGSRV